MSGTLASEDNSKDRTICIGSAATVGAIRANMFSKSFLLLEEKVRKDAMVLCPFRILVHLNNHKWSFNLLAKIFPRVSFLRINLALT